MDYRYNRCLLSDSQIRVKYLSKDSRGRAVAPDAGALHHLSDSQGMLIVRNDIIPFDGYKAITLWPFIFVRTCSRFAPEDERHERIHGRQQAELLIVLFYALYALFYLYGLVRYHSHKKAYRSNPFEAEAYACEDDTDYLQHRKIYAWTKYF